jgi:molecular chaperone GrpE
VKEKNIKEVEITDEESIEETNETNLEEKITQLEQEVVEFKDKLLRKAAEFENYKRRTENDQLNLLTFAAESFIQKLLPVIDDFERSLGHVDEAQDITAIKQGLKLIYDKLMKVLDEQGVKKIESVGNPFDVDYHEALMQRPDDSVEPHTVLDEMEKGYTYKDKVIRHAKVIVSEEKSSEPKE